MSKFRSFQRAGLPRWLSLLLVTAFVLTACVAPAAGPAPAAPVAEATTAPAEEAAAPADAMTTIYGETLPDDALPYEEQVSYSSCPNNTSRAFPSRGL